MFFLKDLIKLCSGSVLDGFDTDDANRPFSFCSVFKMEERKGKASAMFIRNPMQCNAFSYASYPKAGKS